MTGEPSNDEFIDRILEFLRPKFTNDGNTGVQGENYGTAVGSAKDCLFTEVHYHVASSGMSCVADDGTGCGGSLQKNNVLWEQNTNLTSGGLIEILNRFALRAIPPEILKPVKPNVSDPPEPTDKLPGETPFTVKAIVQIVSIGIGCVLAGFVASFIVLCIIGLFVDISDILRDAIGILVSLALGAFGVLAAKNYIEDEHGGQILKHKKAWEKYRRETSENEKTLAAYDRLVTTWTAYQSRWPLSWTCMSCGMQHVFQRLRSARTKVPDTSCPARVITPERPGAPVRVPAGRCPRRPWPGAASPAPTPASSA